MFGVVGPPVFIFGIKIKQIKLKSSKIVGYKIQKSFRNSK